MENNKIELNMWSELEDYFKIQRWVEKYVDAIKELIEIKGAAFYSLIMTMICLAEDSDDEKIVEGVTDLFINTIKIHGGKK